MATYTLGAACSQTTAAGRCSEILPEVGKGTASEVAKSVKQLELIARRKSSRDAEIILELAAMKVVLELQDQRSNIRRVTVRHDIVIGRGAECNLRLSAPQVSRRHCFLRIGTDGAFVSDLDSSNGTVLNGDKLNSGKRYMLNDGAVLQVGPLKFLARVYPEEPAPDSVQIHVADDRIEAELEDVQENRSVGFGTTIPEGHFGDKQHLMDLALEQAGASAEGEAPTADCVTPDGPAKSRDGKGAPELSDESIEIVDLSKDDFDEVIELEDDQFDIVEDTFSEQPAESTKPSDSGLQDDLQHFLKGLD